MSELSQTTVADRYTPEEIAGFYEAGFWAEGNLFDVFVEQAQPNPDRPFVHDSTTSLSYADMVEKSQRLALGLKRLGLNKGDRVAVQLPNWTEFVLVVTAAARMGLIVVPIMPIYRDNEVEYVLQHSGARAAVTCADFKGFNYLEMFERIKSNTPDLQHLIVARSQSSGSVSALDDLIVGGDIEEIARELGQGPTGDDGFLIVYTSGTTARPKGCYHTWNTLRASSAAIAKNVNYTSEDVQFGPSPITHSTGIVTSIALPLLSGASSHLMEAWDPAEALDRIKQYGCTASVTATAFLQMLMAAYDPAKHDVSSMRVWICAGAPIPGAIVENASTMFPNLSVLSLLGRSENFLTTMCSVDDPASRSATSDGRPVEGAAVKIVDESGHEVPRGTEGDIAYKGPSHMIEYYRNTEETEALFTPDGFSRSGDLGFMDADSYVRVTGRLKDIIIRGGMNISARELEDLLVQHPAITSVACVAMPDEQLGEKVCAYVVTAEGQPDIDMPTMQEYLLSKNLSKSKLPERIEIIEALPMTATGKIQKHILRDMIAAKVRG